MESSALLSAQPLQVLFVGPDGSQLHLHLLASLQAPESTDLGLGSDMERRGGKGECNKVLLAVTPLASVLCVPLQ